MVTSDVFEEDLLNGRSHQTCLAWSYTSGDVKVIADIHDIDNLNKVSFLHVCPV